MATQPKPTALDARTSAHHHGLVTRRLSPTSFLTSDPPTCAEWLRALGYRDIARRGPGEHARLQQGAGVTVVYASGLVICLSGVR